jgi:hypothetical protein
MGSGWRTPFATAGPPVELIVTSGRCQIAANDLPDRGRFIAKPYDVHALSQVFQEMAGAGTAK